MQDYRFCLPYMHSISSGQKHWREPDKPAMRAVLDRIRSEGPLRAKDFEAPKARGDEWGWDWKPAKIALEQLFIEGKVIVSHREGFQKVYDLPERVLPSDLDTRMPTEVEFERHLIRMAMRSHGLVAEAEISYLRKGMKARVKARLQEMVESGETLQLKVAGQKPPYYTTAAALKSLETKRITKQVHLLSPFDNAVIQRKRIFQLFGSDYQIECYVPAAKRQFGYYCLPVLYGSNLVGRLDPKANRRTGEFIIRALYLEKPIQERADFARKLACKLWQVATFNECRKVLYTPQSKDSLSKLLVTELERTDPHRPVGQ